MTCAESEILLHALLDGELDAGHAREVEAHLESCPRCAAQLHAYRELQQAMPAAQLRFTAPTSLRRRIERALPSAPPRASSRRSVLKGFAMGTALSAAIAASLVIAVIRTDQDQRVLGDVALGACALASGRPPHRRADERPAHGETMVQRQARRRTARRRPDSPGLQADRRAARLYRRQGRRFHRLSAPHACDQSLRRAGSGLGTVAARSSRRCRDSTFDAGARRASSSSPSATSMPTSCRNSARSSRPPSIRPAELDAMGIGLWRNWHSFERGHFFLTLISRRMIMRVSGMTAAASAFGFDDLGRVLRTRR